MYFHLVQVESFRLIVVEFVGLFLFYVFWDKVGFLPGRIQESPETGLGFQQPHFPRGFEALFELEVVVGRAKQAAELEGGRSTLQAHREYIAFRCQSIQL